MEGGGVEGGDVTTQKEVSPRAAHTSLLQGVKGGREVRGETKTE